MVYIITNKLGAYTWCTRVAGTDYSSSYFLPCLLPLQNYWSMSNGHGIRCGHEQMEYQQQRNAGGIVCGICHVLLRANGGTTAYY